jgi:integrative and conjugative element protein (TIGR02256 family)
VPEAPALFVLEDVLAHLLRLPARPWEVGGWLLGYWSEDSTAVVLTHATPPAVRGTPLGITISGRGHRRRFDDAWAASEGRVTFLGDWHSHPGGAAAPSRTDERAMSQLAEIGDYGTPEPIIAIVATGRVPCSSTKPAVHFYIRRRNGDVHRLDHREVDELPAGTRRVPVWPWPREAAKHHR